MKLEYTRHSLLRRMVSSSLAVLMVGSIGLLSAGQAFAANTYLTALSLELETNEASASGWAIIKFTLTSAIAASGTITVDLPTSPAAVTWDASLAVGDLDVLVDASDLTMSAGATAPSGTGKMAYTRTDNDTLTFYNNDTDTIAATSVITIELGDGSGAASPTSDRNAITFPSTASTEADPYIMTITSSGSDSATKLAFNVTTATDGTDSIVNLQSVVLPHITMSLDDSDHSLGEIDETNIGSGVTLFTIDTNAANGWELWYESTAFANDDGNGISFNADTGDASIAAGTENWGMNLVDNAAPDVGTAASVTEAPGTTNALSIEAYYDAADAFGVVVGADGSTLGTRTKIASRSGSTNAQLLYVSFAVAADTTTPAGNYSATVNFIIIGKF